MNYKEQKKKWLEKFPKATPDELKRLGDAWEAGYFQCSENWCNKER